jgi:hypothetical protein
LPEASSGASPSQSTWQDCPRKLLRSNKLFVVLVLVLPQPGSDSLCCDSMSSINGIASPWDSITISKSSKPFEILFFVTDVTCYTLLIL